MARSFATQTVQIGKETTPGVLTPATQRLMALRTPPAPHLEGERFAPQGATAPTVNIPGQEWTEAEVEGKLTYTDAGFVFASAIGKPVTDAPTGATLAKRHVFTFDGRSPADPQTYTMEHGDATLARRFGHAFFNGFSLDIARDALDFSSAMMGHAIETGFAMTATGVTEVDPIPVAAGHWDVYVDDLPANLGTTKFVDAYEVGLEFAERFDPTWPINSALKSFAGIVEKGADDQEHTGTLSVGAEASIEGYLNTIRNGEKKFVRLVATGPTIEAAIKHKIQIDMCVFVTETEGYTDLNGLLVLPFSYQIARDANFGGVGIGGAMTVTMVNKVAQY